jgi:hypothetical protein
VGTRHQGRCTGFNNVDDLAVVSFRESVISQPFLRADEVKVGDVVQCVILEVMDQGSLDYWEE